MTVCTGTGVGAAGFGIGIVRTGSCTAMRAGSCGVTGAAANCWGACGQSRKSGQNVKYIVRAIDAITESPAEDAAATIFEGCSAGTAPEKARPSEPAKR